MVRKRSSVSSAITLETAIMISCLIDWKMHDMDGIEVTRRIRAEVGYDVPIVMISAYDYVEIEEEARARV